MDFQKLRNSSFKQFNSENEEKQIPSFEEIFQYPQFWKFLNVDTSHIDLLFLLLPGSRKSPFYSAVVLHQKALFFMWRGTLRNKKSPKKKNNVFRVQITKFVPRQMLCPRIPESNTFRPPNFDQKSTIIERVISVV